MTTILPEWSVFYFMMEYYINLYYITSHPYGYLRTVVRRVFSRSSKVTIPNSKVSVFITKHAYLWIYEHRFFKIVKSHRSGFWVFATKRASLLTSERRRAPRFLKIVKSRRTGIRIPNLDFAVFITKHASILKYEHRCAPRFCKIVKSHRPGIHIPNLDFWVFTTKHASILISEHRCAPRFCKIVKLSLIHISEPTRPY